MKKQSLVCAAIAGVIAMPPGLQAATHSTEPPASAASDGRTTEGEVRKVDRNTREITIRHAELKHLDMPAMTMVFQVKDPSMLDMLKQGDKVNFVAEKSGSRFIVTRIETRQ